LVSTSLKARRLRRSAATALVLDAFAFLAASVTVVVLEGCDPALVVPLLVICILGFFAWLGLRPPGWAGGCLLPLAFIGFLSAALGAALAGVSLAWFVLFLVFWTFIPLVAGVLFLVARWKERQGGGAAR
jgi:hypothetical protein